MHAQHVYPLLTIEQTAGDRALASFKSLERRAEFELLRSNLQEAYLRDRRRLVSRRRMRL